MSIVIPERFWRRVDKREDGCWVWTGTTTTRRADPSSYGRCIVNGKEWPTHRLVYVALRGPIPAGLHLDHLCRNRLCCNPDHVEPVSPRENIRRGLHGLLRTHCPHGHELTPDNVYIKHRKTRGVTERVCRACKRAEYTRRPPLRRPLGAYV